MRVHSILLSTVVTSLCIAHSILLGEQPKELFHQNFTRTSAIVAPGKIMDKDVMCILDTGATTCAMDMRFAAGLSISASTEQVGTASGLITVQRFEKITQRLTGFPQRTSPAVALDLTDFSVSMGMQIDAVLG